MTIKFLRKTGGSLSRFGGKNDVDIIGVRRTAIRLVNSASPLAKLCLEREYAPIRTSSDNINTAALVVELVIDCDFVLCPFLKDPRSCVNNKV